jgi:hypothetical protein
MSNKKMRTKAEELLDFGMTKQQVYDFLLLEFPEAKPKKVAEVLRYRPTLWAKERFRELHSVLLGLIALSALLRMLPAVMQDTIRWDMPTAYLSLVPIATLLLGYSLFVWQGEVFEWVGWGNVMGALGLLSSLKGLNMQDADLGALLMKVLSIAIGAIALYLARKVFAKPEVVKDPLGQAKLRYVFPVEGA